MSPKELRNIWVQTVIRQNLVLLNHLLQVLFNILHYLDGHITTGGVVNSSAILK